jgi:hypothetical protein
MADKVLSVDERKAVFLALVQEQDKGADPVAARRAVARWHGLSTSGVRAIEQEGLANDWPPLDEG